MSLGSLGTCQDILGRRALCVTATAVQAFKRPVISRFPAAKPRPWVVRSDIVRELHSCRSGGSMGRPPPRRRQQPAQVSLWPSMSRRRCSVPGRARGRWHRGEVLGPLGPRDGTGVGGLVTLLSTVARCFFPCLSTAHRPSHCTLTGTHTPHLRPPHGDISWKAETHCLSYPLSEWWHLCCPALLVVLTALDQVWHHVVS